MKHSSTNPARFALTAVALATGCLWGAPSWALGLGRLSVQSALGETLKAEIEVISITPEEAASLRLRVAPPDAYRAAGIEYNAVLSGTQVQMQRRPDGRTVLRLSSDRAVLEPFVDVMIEANWASGRLIREYTLLFDPPGSRLSQAGAAPPTAPLLSAAPAAQPMPLPPQAAAPVAPPPAAAPHAAPAAPPAPPAVAPTAPTVAQRPAPTPAPAAAAPVAKPVAPAPATGDQEVRVRRGDTLSGIAGRNLRGSVSLDQMLVSMFRANPQAFAGANMNRLIAGTVLSVPTADATASLSYAQAREVIVAQSADFDAYRQRLASGTTTQADNQPARQSKGQVQAQVDDRKLGGSAPPDKLTLSQGGVKLAAPEAGVAGGRKDEQSRLAELARNVDELKKLQGAAAPGAATGAAPAPAAAVVAAAPTAPAAPAAAVVPVATPSPAATKPVAAPTPAAATKPEESSLIDSLADNPLLLPGAGVLLALLAGLGLWRLRSRRKPAGETSFLESRLQPDSFFGASGGQRVDTRDAVPGASGASSSMGYSLSQLDAIGDVDPVAEADVYLAYGRDLQAEEILKEAMRSTPERMAIRSKLLEVYAKRRDTKGFELLATQMFNVTHGQGDDWAQAQVMGLGIDPQNPLYQPGAAPEEVLGAHGQVVEPLGASTVPYTAPAGPPAFEPAADARLDAGMDLDLDLELLGADTAVMPGEATQAFATGVERADEARPVTLPDPVHDGGLDFDLGEFKLDELPLQGQAGAATDATPAFDGLGAGADESDPLERKLDLAEEFRQIGDLEGARDLLEEVLSKAEGTLRAKAQTMLDGLG